MLSDMTTTPPETNVTEITGGIVIGILADLAPGTLALMHGSSFDGDGRQALLDLAGPDDQRYLAGV